MLAHLRKWHAAALFFASLNTVTQAAFAQAPAEQAGASMTICGRAVAPSLRAEFDREAIPLLVGSKGTPLLIDRRGDGRKALVVIAEAPPMLLISEYDAQARTVAQEQVHLKSDNLVPQPFAGDFDGDGCEDVALLDVQQREVSVSWSDCQRLGSPQPWITKLEPGEVLVGDLNGDGRRDLLVAASEAREVAYLSNGRAGVAAQPWSLDRAPGVWRGRVLADRNNDSTDDLLLVDREGKLLSAYSNATNAFVGAEQFIPPRNNSMQLDALYLGDFDGDGSRDFLVRDGLSDSLCLLRPGPGDPHLCPMISFFGGTPWTHAVVGDFDGNGMEELLVYRWRARAWTRYRWRSNMGEEDLIELTLPQELDVASATMLAGDIDGDGLDDLVFGDSARGGWSFVRSKLSVPWAGGKIALRSGAQVTTAADGRFCVSSTATGEEAIVPPLPKAAEPWIRIVRFIAGKTRRNQNFLIHGVQPVEGPQLCVGVSEGSWGRNVRCPEGYGFFGLDDGRYPQHSPGYGPCCPLPSSDILRGEVFAAEQECPEASIAIGWTTECKDCVFKILCRRINDQRYLLGPESEGAYWGFGFTRWEESLFVPKMLLPPTLRHAIGRNGFASWDVDGCVGFPVGSLLTGRPGGYCSGTRFRQLQYRGGPGDPPAGTPVKMLPDCLEIDTIFRAGARCRK